MCSCGRSTEYANFRSDVEGEILIFFFYLLKTFVVSTENLHGSQTETKSSLLFIG